jgi:hypothetical protein
MPAFLTVARNLCNVNRQRPVRPQHAQAEQAHLEAPTRLANTRNFSRREGKTRPLAQAERFCLWTLRGADRADTRISADAAKQR